MSACAICRQPITDDDSMTVKDGRPTHIKCARMRIVVEPVPAAAGDEPALPAGLKSVQHMAEAMEHRRIQIEALDRQVASLKAELAAEKERRIKVQRDAWDTVYAVGLACGLPPLPDPQAPDALRELPPEWRGKCSDQVRGIVAQRDAATARLAQVERDFAEAVAALREAAPMIRRTKYYVIDYNKDTIQHADAPCLRDRIDALLSRFDNPSATAASAAADHAPVPAGELSERTASGKPVGRGDGGAP